MSVTNGTVQIPLCLKNWQFDEVVAIRKIVCAVSGKIDIIYNRYNTDIPYPMW